MEGEMNHEVTNTARMSGVVRVAATIMAVILLPPFIALAVLPMLLFMAPVALIGIPFIIPALITGSLAAREEEKQRASWRPPVPAMLPQRSNLRAVN